MNARVTMAELAAYCERVGDGVLSEPLNAVTNLAFLVAAYAAWRMLRQRAVGTRSPVSLVALIVILVAIGLGSLAFHTFAGWTVILDVVPIAMFMVFGFVCALHYLWGLRWPLAWIGAPAFLAFAAGMSVLTSALDLPPGNYVAALLLMAGVAVVLGLDPDRRPYAGRFALAAAVFAVSLTFRTVDEPICGAVPIGTHFLWHLLNACVLFLVLRALILRWREVSTGSQSPSQP